MVFQLKVVLIGIKEILITQMNNGLFSAGVLYFDEKNRKEGEAFFRLKQFHGDSLDSVWKDMDTWVNEFNVGTGGFEYYEK